MSGVFDPYNGCNMYSCASKYLLCDLSNFQVRADLVKLSWPACLPDHAPMY